MFNTPLVVQNEYLEMTIIYYYSGPVKITYLLGHSGRPKPFLPQVYDTNSELTIEQISYY